MDADHLSIRDLVELSGVPRRTIRYYVQRGLVPPPEGAGRGHYYTQAHLEQLRQVRALQQAGRSLDEIKGLIGDISEQVDGMSLHLAAPARAAFAPSPVPEVSLTTRIRIDDGIELLVSPPSKMPEPRRLAELATAIRQILETDGDSHDRDH